MRVVVIEDGPERLKAYLGALAGTGTVYYVASDGDEAIYTQDDPTVRPTDEWAAEVGDGEIKVDNENPKIQLDDGRIKWGINCWWLEVVPQPR
jgi:hypothetical protein